MPKVSYVMTISRKRFLKEAIDSALNQYMDDIEVIIGDSTGVFDGHSDKRIREINTEGLNVTQALNVLIEDAHSDIILNLSDDDIDFPNRAEVCYNALEDADIFCGSYNRMDVDGIVYADEIIKPFDLDKFIAGRLNMPMCSGAYRKSTVPRWSEKYPYTADLLLFIEAHKKGLRIKTSEEIVMKMRYWSEQMCDPKNSHISRAEIADINKTYGLNIYR